MGQPMWKLTIVDDQGKETKLALARSQYSIGRSEENTVRLTDRNISRQHMTLRKSDDVGWVVEDLNSYNGCFVNGMRVAGTHPLYHGDLLQVGDYRIELVDESALVTADGEKTLLMANPLVASLLDRPDRLVIVDGSAAGTEFPLEGERIVIGRAEDVDISINHSSVSRIHAEIVSLGAGVYEIFDRGSSNGLRVNGMKFVRRVIEDDDELELGSVRLRFVARGRIFRPGASVRGYAGPTDDVGVWAGRSFRKRVAMVLGGLLAAVVVVVVVVVLAKQGSRATASEAYRLVEDQAILQEAKTLSELGRHDEAHEKVMSLPMGSPLRDSTDVQVIEGKWADEVRARVAVTSDNQRRKELLQQVASAPLVDGERRRIAAEQLAALDAKENGTDPGSLPRAGGEPVGNNQESAGADDNVGGSAAPSRSKSSPSKQQQQSQPAATKPPSRSSSRSIYEIMRDKSLSSDEKNAELRKRLYGQVSAGTSNREHIRILRNACKGLKDEACVKMCTQREDELKEE